MGWSDILGKVVSVGSKIGGAVATAAPYIGKGLQIGSQMGLFGNLFGGGDSGTSAYDLQVQQYENQRKLNQQAYDLTQRGYRESALNQRIGYENAGLNPMLMAGNVMNGQFSGGSAALGSSDKAAMRESVTNATRLIAGELRQMNANVNATNAQAVLAGEQAKTEANKRQNFDMDSLLKQSQIILNDKNASWYDKRQAAEIRTMIMNAQANQVASNAQQLTAETGAQWTPARIGAGLLGSAALIFGPGKVLKPIGSGLKSFGKGIRTYKGQLNAPRWFGD